MNMQHTPGPWKMDQGGYERKYDDGTPWRTQIVGTEAGETIAEVYVPKGEHWYHPTTQANSKLICAAPDMLSALEALFENCAMIHKYGGEISNQKEADAAIEAARAAIAKAKGES